MGTGPDDSTFHPPLEERSDAALFKMIRDAEEWQPYARALAEAVLRNRGVRQEEIDEVKSAGARSAEWLKEHQAWDMARRKVEGYTAREALIILLGWPALVMLELTTHHLVTSGKGLWTLSGEKRWRKFWQRCALIPASLTLYGFVITTFF